MKDISISSQSVQGKIKSNVENLTTVCQEKFSQILSKVLVAKGQEAHKAEASIFKTTKGIVKHGKTSEKNYFSMPDLFWD